MMFQSSPAPKGRCNGVASVLTTPSAVSILTGPEGPVQPVSVSTGFGLEVSILTGPEGPVQPAWYNPPVRREEFQSSPAPKGRCNRRRRARGHGLPRVSILTGPEGPVQPAPTPAGSPRSKRFNPHRPRRAGATRGGNDREERPMFQSSPAPKGRCNIIYSWGGDTAHKFQSSPAPKGRCNGPPSSPSSPPACFNPHRPRRAGATGRPSR